MIGKTDRRPPALKRLATALRIARVRPIDTRSSRVLK